MRSARDSSSAAASPPVSGAAAAAATADPPIKKKRRRSTPAAFLLSPAGALPLDGLLIAISSKSYSSQVLSVSSQTFDTLHRHSDSVKASDSSSINRRPTRP